MLLVVVVGELTVFCIVRSSSPSASPVAPSSLQEKRASLSVALATAAGVSEGLGEEGWARVSQFMIFVLDHIKRCEEGRHVTLFAPLNLPPFRCCLALRRKVE